MEASRTYRADAIVLRRINIGETDRVVTLYTRSRGKVGAIAKGARKALSKLAASTEPFTYGRYMLALGQTLDVITQVEIRESFTSIRKDVELIATAIYFLELVDSMLEDRQPNLDIFDTLLSSLYMLERGLDREVIARAFEIKLLALLGYEPQLARCLRCDAVPKGEELTYSPSLGGLACLECGPLPEDVIYIRRETADTLKRLLKAEPSELARMLLPPEVGKQAAEALRWHIRYRVERDLKSTEFLQSLSVTTADEEL